MSLAAEAEPGLPDMKVSIRQLFGIDSDLEVPAYSEPDEHVPDLDPDYRFHKPTTLAITAPESRRISSKWRHGSIGLACASTSTAILAASISSAKTPSSSARACRSPSFVTASCHGRYRTMLRSAS